VCQQPTLSPALHHHDLTQHTGVDSLPTPLDARVTNKQLEGGLTAALRFGGLPLPFEVTGAEKRLREALLRDGLQPKGGYRWVGGWRCGMEWSGDSLGWLGAGA
jgi:hypothetical protein